MTAHPVIDSDFPTFPVLPALAAARLYGIVDLAYVDPPACEQVAARLIEGGIDVLQLRAKDHQPTFIEKIAAQIHRLSAPAGVPLVINDFPESADRVRCEGAHVGQDDDPVAKARELAGAGRIIGKSTHSLQQAVAAAAEGADYIGFGPLFPTPTKAGRPAIGLDDLAALHAAVAIPVFCIGGIKLDNLPAVIAAGARRVVIVSAWLKARDIAAAVRTADSLLPALPLDRSVR